MVIPSNVISLWRLCSIAKAKVFHCWNHGWSFMSEYLLTWNKYNFYTIIFARSTLTFFQGRVQESYHPWDGVYCDNSCGKVFGFTFYSKEIINDKSFCDKHRSTRVNWLSYVHIFFMSAETSLCVSCVLAHQHAHKLSSLVKSRLHVHSQASI